VVLLTMLARPRLYGVAPFDITGAPFTALRTDRSVWLGTDYLGRDVLAGLLVGGRADGAGGRWRRPPWR
jgi:peptide/nickel transport system permease protein